MTVDQGANVSEGLTLALAVLNVIQTGLLAWIASRGTRRRRQDRA